MKRWRRLAFLVVVIGAGPSLAYGQAAAAPATRAAAAASPFVPQTIRLTLHPRAIPRPALENRLLPTVGDETTGNAAPLYLLACLHTAQVPESAGTLTDEIKRRYGEDAGDATNLTYLFLNLPLERLPQDEVDRFLHAYDLALRCLDRAALRDHCRWDLPIQEDGLDVTRAHLMQLRKLADVAMVRTRLCLARRDQSGAARSMRSCFKLARDLDQEASLLQAMVGASIAASTLERGVAEWVQRPDAPNLYWQLAGLPRPYMDYQAALRLEQAGLLIRFPELSRLKTGRLTAQEWHELSEKIGRLTGGADDKQPSVISTLQAIAAESIMYGEAKRWLAEQGVAAAEIEATPVALAVARHHFGQYEEWYDEFIKWTGLPFPQAYLGLQRATPEFERSREDNPLLRTIPLVPRAYFNLVRGDRYLAALQTVEAIRAYAAAHDGRLPTDLAALEADGVPVPADPSRNGPFDYAVQGDAFTLSSPPPPGVRPFAGLRVEATLAK